MDRKIFLNYLYNIFYQIVKIVLPFFLVPYTMSHLGASVLGINDFASNIANWFILFGILGINIYGNRQLAKVRDNRKELSKEFFEILAVQLINMLISTIFYILYIVLFVKENSLIYYLVIITVVSSAFDITWLYYAVENFKTVSLRNVFVKLLGVACIFIFIKKPEDLWLYVVINGVSDLIGHIITYSGLHKYIDFVPFSVKDAYKKHLTPTFLLFIPTIANNVYALCDQTMLGFMIEDKSAVALYKAAQGFVKMFIYFVTSIGAVVMPRISNLFGKGNNKGEIEKFINQSFGLVCLLAIPMMLGMAAISPNFFGWYLPGEPSIVLLVQVSCPLILLLSLNNLYGTQYLVPTEHTNEFTISTIVGACVNCVSNFILIKLFGGIGACLGSVIAETSTILVQRHYVRKDITVKGNKCLFKCLIASIIMALAVYYIGNVMPSSFINNIIQVVIGVLIYALLLLLLKEENFRYYLDKILKKDKHEKTA